MIPKDLKTVLDTPQLRRLPLGVALLKVARMKKHQVPVPQTFCGEYNYPHFGRVESDFLTISRRALCFYNYMAKQRRSLAVPVKAWLNNEEWNRVAVATKGRHTQADPSGRVYRFD